MSPRPSIAHYRIVSKLGEGGMGAVYRATDTKLNRDVAIKVLPEAFSSDTARMARFEREAQLLASINHPNIAAIYGIEEGAIVMELVEGADLAGPVPVDTAIAYARQIAAGLEAAHERGIIHRDLKPANIKVTPDGTVKLLDFGLAKATEQSSAATTDNPTMSPTLSLAMTQAGMILGTAAYMSPEQARGKPVDKRTDIWAFGVVLFELITGGMLFGGETVSDSLAAVIRSDPDWAALPKETPPQVRRLLVRCLCKDPRQRLRDIGEARILLEEPAETVPAPAAPARRSWLPWTIAGACAALALALGGLLWRATPTVERPLLRFSADMGPEALAGIRITAAISPDGTRLAYPVQPAGGGTVLLATRLMDQSKPTVLSGTENAADPFFSPDGQWIGFFADQHLKKVSIQGGAPSTLCDVPTALRGADWSEDGNIVFGLAGLYGLARIPASGGGTPQSLTKPPAKGEATHRWPQILPGGQAILFTGHTSGAGFDDANIEVAVLKTGKTKVVQRGGYFGRYLPSGHLVFLHQGALFAVPFNLARYETSGTPAPILEDVTSSPSTGGAQLDFSRTGTLVYLSGKSNDASGALFRLEAAGKKEPLVVAAGLRSPRFSPDGKRVAYSSTGNIWVYDLARGSKMSLTVNPNGTDTNPVWTPDGNHIAYAPSLGGIWWVRSDGSSQPQMLYALKSGGAVPGSFTPDGRYLAFHQAGTDTGRDIWILPLDTTDPDRPKAGAPELFLATKSTDVEPAFSPDGRWLAYTSFQSGVPHIFVRAFPEGAKGGGQAQISTVSGRYPLWSRTAREIFYATNDGHIMVVPYTLNGRSFEPGKPREWTGNPIFPTGTYQWYDLAPDGKHIVAFPAKGAAEGEEKVDLHLTFLLNFFDELKRRVH